MYSNLPPASSMTMGSNKLELLPPSVFERPSSGVEDPWKSLSRATNEILELRKQLEQMK